MGLRYRCWIPLSVALLMLLALPLSTFAKATIFPPEKMLHEADVIFTEDIISFTTPKKGDPRITRIAKVKVDNVLKGELDSQIVTLIEYQFSLAVTQKFPEEKEKILSCNANKKGIR